MRHMFLVNPAAGSSDSTEALLARIRQFSLPHEVVFTRGVGHARALAQEAGQQGTPLRIYACGGDGTLNEVVNGVAGLDHVAITCVPKGTGNDFLKVFGPNYLTLFQDLEALAQGHQVAMDLMDCNGLLGINVVCSGVDARIGVDVAKYKRKPLISGIGAYILGLLEHLLFRGITRPMQVQMGSLTYEGEVAILCICNGRQYGGGFMPMPEAVPNDGKLDMLLIPDLGWLPFVRMIGEYAKGRYTRYPNLVHSYHGTAISWASQQELIVSVDGEILRGTHFTLRLSEKKIQFFYPSGASLQPPAS